MKNNIKYIYIPLAILILVGVAVGWWWQKNGSVTKIALVSYTPFHVSNMALSNEDPRIRYDLMQIEEIRKFRKYDFVLINGMGLKISDEERAEIIEISKKTPVHFSSVTNPANEISSLTDEQKEQVDAFLKNSSIENYQNFARYVRRYIDHKTFYAEEPGTPKENEKDVYFHTDRTGIFRDLDSYQSYIEENDWYREDAPRVAIVAGIHDPYSAGRGFFENLIDSLQEAGMNVYPFTSSQKRLEFLEEIQPDAVIYFPHGRLLPNVPDRAVDWLKSHNIPFFTPLSVIQTRDEWLDNPLGMSGGYMGQTIVMPELDGALYPYVFMTQNVNEDGLYALETIPERLGNFVEIIQRHITLKKKENREKKIAVVYFRGNGKSGLNASGLEAEASLYAVLKRMRTEGYQVEGLPENEAAFRTLLNRSGQIFDASSEGAIEHFIESGDPVLVEGHTYDAWLKEALEPEDYRAITEQYGEAPGHFMTTRRDGKDYLALSAISLGNIVLLPQPAAAIGGDEFEISHGVKENPPHPYIGAYLWAQHGFEADAFLHFGTHGSLEFTPHKQVALSGQDWPDLLIGNIPHVYYYTIANVGEAIMPKRRTYAAIVSHLNPHFMESEMRGEFDQLQKDIVYYYKAEGTLKEEAALRIKKKAVELGLHRDLNLDSMLSRPYSLEDIERLENFAEEIATEKINAENYTTGQPYAPEKIHSTVSAMSVDPIAWSLAMLDKDGGKVTDEELKNKVFFTREYLQPAKKLVEDILAGNRVVNDNLLQNLTGAGRPDLMRMRMMMGSELPAGRPSVSSANRPESEDEGMKRPSGSESDTQKPVSRPNIPDLGKVEGAPAGPPIPAQKPDGITSASVTDSDKSQPEISEEMKERFRLIHQVEETLNNIGRYRTALMISPELEMESLLNALSGGYTVPSSGGDLVANPDAIPTGRNLYSVNPESTPSVLAWDRGMKLVDETIEDYQKKHGNFPTKIAFTFWSSEFVETDGVSIAQVLYLLGVEPVWDTHGRVSDIRLIPSDELGRPRIDVVIQTSGQFRDLAASRLFLITKAIRMAAAAEEEGFQNYVREGSVSTEEELVRNGMSPKMAREMSSQRIFGGLQGRYDTGIKELITQGDRWDSQQEIALQYMHNMGAFYGDEEGWGAFQEGLLKASLKNTDVLIHPRQNNTWGALSLDHVYEFMGGLNSAIREVTGEDPEAYMADYRNRHRMRMQELKEAIGVEARATIFNPKYVKEMMNGKASTAIRISDVVTNMFGWTATRDGLIDQEMWDQFYDIYIEDKNNLGIRDFVLKENPAVLQQSTAVLLESSRKGMWMATEDQLNELAALHQELVRINGAESSGFALNNQKLQDYIADHLDADQQTEFRNDLRKMSESSDVIQVADHSKVLRKETLADDSGETGLEPNVVGTIRVVALAFAGLIYFVRRRRKQEEA